MDLRTIKDIVPKKEDKSRDKGGHLPFVGFMNFCSWAKTVYPFSSTAILYWSLYGIPTAQTRASSPSPAEAEELDNTGIAAAVGW